MIYQRRAEPPAPPDRPPAVFNSMKLECAKALCSVNQLSVNKASIMAAKGPPGGNSVNFGRNVPRSVGEMRSRWHKVRPAKCFPCFDQTDFLRKRQKARAEPNVPDRRHISP